MKDDGRYGEIHNPGGAICRRAGVIGPWWDRRIVFEVTLDPVDPLTYQHPDGYFVQPDRHFYCDFGSVPWPFSLVVSRYGYPATWQFHDAGCQKHVLYYSESLAHPFDECPVSSADVHALMRLMIRCEGAREWQARLAYRGVTSRWGKHWQAGDPPPAVPEWELKLRAEEARS